LRMAGILSSTGSSLVAPSPGEPKSRIFER
jgi:hypothetical protein